MLNKLISWLLGFPQWTTVDAGDVNRVVDINRPATKEISDEHEAKMDNSLSFFAFSVSATDMACFLYLLVCFVWLSTGAHSAVHHLRLPFHNGGGVTWWKLGMGCAWQPSRGPLLPSECTSALLAFRVYVSPACLKSARQPCLPSECTSALLALRVHVSPACLKSARQPCLPSECTSALLAFRVHVSPACLQSARHQCSSKPTKWQTPMRNLGLLMGGLWALECIEACLNADWPAELLETEFGEEQYFMPMQRRNISRNSSSSFLK
eukprot:32092-Pelagomonas_calceolata.AAC.3